MNKHTLVIAVAVAIATVGVAQAGPTANAPQPSHPVSSSPQLSPAQRGALVNQIVRTWAPYVQNVQGANINVWVGRMKGTFAAATDANLQRAAGMKTFQGAMDALLGQQVTDVQVHQSLALQAKVLNAGVRPALLGSVSSDLSIPRSRRVAPSIHAWPAVRSPPTLRATSTPGSPAISPRRAAATPTAACRAPRPR